MLKKKLLAALEVNVEERLEALWEKMQGQQVARLSAGRSEIFPKPPLSQPLPRELPPHESFWLGTL